MRIDVLERASVRFVLATAAALAIPSCTARRCGTLEDCEAEAHASSAQFTVDFHAAAQRRSSSSPLSAVAPELRGLLGAAGDRPLLGRVVRALRCETILVLSGGAQNGAFGAGFLYGWSERQRIAFDTITGVSTGALQAPLVFVGTPDSLDSLREGYLSAGVDEVIEMRGLAAIPFCASLASSRGLESLIRRHITNGLIDQVAAQGRLGRRLFVATTNLDTGCLTVWDLVAIANARDYSKFREIVYASSCVPPIFEPRCIDGALHADGGIRQQLFIADLVEKSVEEHQTRRAALMAELGATASGKSLSAALSGIQTGPIVYFVVNSYLGSRTECTDFGLVPIAVRSSSLMADEALLGTIWKAFGQHELGGTACGEPQFRLVSLPKSALIPDKSSMEYDRADMLALFEAGSRVAALPDPWLEHPKELPNLVVHRTR
jgi:hypothetical protein